MTQLLLIAALAAGLVLLAIASQQHQPGSRRFPSRAAKPRLCPHLGLPSDPFKHYPGANDEHRCYANLGRERIDLAHQRRFCLASCYGRCPFLIVQETGPLQRIWAWVRAVSPIPQAQPGDPRRLGGSPWASPTLPKLGLAGRRMGAKMLPFLRELNPLIVNLVVWVVQRGVPLASAGVRRLLSTCWHASPRRRPAIVPITEVAIGEPPRIALAEPVQAATPEPVHSVDADIQTDLVEAGGEDGDLIECGIRAIEGGDEATAYRLFTRASKMYPHDLRAWFWRAKTAETLDEIITCLERALALEPGSTQINANLDWAIQRREEARASRAAKKARASAAKQRRPLAPGRPTAGERFRGFGLEVTRSLTAVAAFGIGAAWLLSALPPDLRQAISTATDLRVLQVPEAALVFAQLPMPVLDGGYQTASALPYGLGFLAEFVGFGLLSGQGWTRAWAPLVGLASAWLWFHADAGLPSDLVLLGCAVVASGGVLASDAGLKDRVAAGV